MSHDVYSNNYFIEFTEGSVSKASAIQKLKDSLDVDEIVAFGDNTNDIEMLTHADRSYVTANGISDVKSHATKIIGNNNEDSVAQFIKKDFYLVSDIKCANWNTMLSHQSLSPRPLVRHSCIRLIHS